jgi:putative transposase
LFTTTRYIDLNPVRANLVSRPEEYEYSSYSMYIGMRVEKLISSERMLSYFKGDNKRNLYQDFLFSLHKIIYRLEKIV